MNSLFDITGEFLALYGMVDDEDDQAFLDTLESLTGELATKAEGYVNVINQLEMESKRAKEVADSFEAKAKVRENAVKRMKEALLVALDVAGKTELPAGDFTIKVQKNGGLEPIVIDGNVPDNMTKVIVEPDKKKIRDYLKTLDGNKCEWAHLEERGRHIKIK